MDVLLKSESMVVQPERYSVPRHESLRMLVPSHIVAPILWILLGRFWYLSLLAPFFLQVLDNSQTFS